MAANAKGVAHDALLALAILFRVVAGQAAGDDEPLPIVCERYDAISVVHEHSAERSWEVTRLYFWRGGRVIADRIVCDDMLFHVEGADFVVAWNDYGNCHRIIRTTNWRERTDNLDDVDINDVNGNAAPWWGMGRRMTDLQAPK